MTSPPKSAYRPISGVPCRPAEHDSKASWALDGGDRSAVLGQPCSAGTPHSVPSRPISSWIPSGALRRGGEEALGGGGQPAWLQPRGGVPLRRGPRRVPAG